MFANSGKERERSLEAVSAHAKPREAPPPADAAEIRAAVHAEWDAFTGRRVLLWRAARLAATPVVIGAAVLLAVNVIRPREPALIARVDRVVGAVEVGNDHAGHASIDLASGLAQGAVVAAHDGHVALRLVPGGSLRLGPNARVELTAAQEAELLAGLLYSDSENAPGERAFGVGTAFGSLRDVGTQFIARVDGDALEGSVRDGRVAVARGGDHAEVGFGGKLVVRQGAWALQRSAIATFGDEWAWTEVVAPPFGIDGHTLADVLSWVSAQTGREIAFDAPATEDLARTTILHGSIDLEPLTTLAAVLAITDLSYTVDGRTILISGQ